MLAYLMNTANGQGHSNALALWKSTKLMFHRNFCSTLDSPTGSEP